MRLDQIAARSVHRHIPHTTQRDPKAVPTPNLLDQDFSSPAPDRKWVSDITYIETEEGWLYLAAILDLFSCREVGWAMDEHMEASLAQNVWNMAIFQRNPSAELLHHSDQDGQYTTDLYQQSLAAHHCRVSMSRVGNCFDNAAMESFFSTLKLNVRINLLLREHKLALPSSSTSKVGTIGNVYTLPLIASAPQSSNANRDIHHVHKNG